MTIQTELAIVGGGPAGLAAAIEAARRGLRVTLVDLGEQPGGALALQTHAYNGTGMHGAAIGALLWHAAESAGATLLPRTLAWGLFEDRALGLAVSHGTEDERSDLLHADVVLIATGALDRFTPFPGATLPGVMTATAAMVMMHRWRVRPGARVCVVGKEEPISGFIVRYAREAGIGDCRHLPSSEGIRAIAGPDGTLAAVEQWHGESCLSSMLTDALILAEGMQPANELAQMRDCAMAWSAPLGGHVPRRDAGMETSVPGISIAGDAAGIGDAGSAMLQGRVAAAAIADRLGKRKQPFGPFPMTLSPGAFRPVPAAVWRSVQSTEAAR
ncbi:MAG: FAD-dependent oxidoreductase [Thermomicrobiales bacterium]